MILSERVQERMTERGLTQSELARRVGVAQPTIYKLLRTAKKGSTHLHRIARELGTTPAYLSGETEDPDQDAPPAPEVTFEERKLLDSFAMLGPVQRQALLTIAQTMADKLPSGSVHTPAQTYTAPPLER